MYHQLLRIITRIIHQNKNMSKYDPFRTMALARFSTAPPPDNKPPPIVLKCPKGTRDLGPKESAIRRQAINKIVEVFQRHGGVELDTPVFELTDLLVGKYGSESKLIYDLADQGGEQLSLRYDLTVPFSRYMASNGIKKIKRYQVGKVYRRDNPVMTKGRFRQFYQCDFDLAGQYDPMLPQAEVLKIVNDVLQSLKLGKFIIRINSRAILEQMIKNAGIPMQMFKTTCSSLDKLDKISWQDVSHELVVEKGLPKAAVDKMQEIVKLSGSIDDIIELLNKIPILPGVEAILDSFCLLNGYIKAYGIEKNVRLDLSLARGLDYYTGLIFEANFLGDNAELGSVAAGGRYDRLIGDLSGHDLPAVGGSIGIERIFAALQKGVATNKFNKSIVLVASIGKKMAIERMKILNWLWQNGIKAQHVLSQNPKPQKQLTFAFQELIPMILWVGEDEVKSGIFNLKILYKGNEIKGSLQELLPLIKKEQAEFMVRVSQGPIVFQKDEKKKKK